MANVELQRQVEAHRAVRARLWNPPSAVRDNGIDLTREVKPPLVALVEQAESIVEELAFDAELIQELAERKRSIFDRVKNIQCAVAAYYGKTRADIIGPSRRAAFVRARHVAMYIAYKLLPDASTTWIGRRFHRDHTSIIHAVAKIDRTIPIDALLRDEVARLMTLVSAEGAV